MIRRIQPWLAVVCGLVGICHCGHAQFGERREGVVTTVSLFPADGVISVHEPLIAKVTWTNGGAEPALILMGNDRRPSVQFEATDAAGHVVLPLPKPPDGQVYDELVGMMQLQPGQSRSQYWIISALHDFDQPGQYTLRAREGSGGKATLIGELALQVLPHDPVRLEVACDRMHEPLRGHPGAFSTVPGGTLIKALYSVRDEVALPYLASMASDKYACRAIRRIGTPRAQRLLELLVTFPDRTGEAAKASLKMSLEPTLWDATGDLQ